MTRLPTPGEDDGNWGDILNEFLLAAHNHDGSLTPEAVGAAGAIQSGMDAGGDLTGTFPNPVVNSLGGVTINTTSTPAAGQVLTADNEQNASWADAPGAGPSTHYLVVDDAAITAQNQTITPSAGGITRLVMTGTTWQANTTYDPTTALVSGGNGDFYTATVIAGISGSTEPTWPTDGSTVTDGPTVQWLDASSSSSNNWYLITWSAHQSVAPGTFVESNGYLFQNGDGEIETTGSTEPNWSSMPDYGDSVMDGGVSWINVGTAVTWAPSTRYTQIQNNGSTAVIPTTPNGHLYIFGVQNSVTAARSGGTMPAFQTNTQGNATPFDGDLSWSVATSVTISLAAGTDYENAWLLLPASGPDFTQVTVTIGTGSATVSLNQFIEVIYSAADSQWFSLA